MNKLLFLTFLVSLISGPHSVDAAECMCGWFVGTMVPGLSNLPALEELPGGQLDSECEILRCVDICAAQGNEVEGLDLMETVDGQTRGQSFCDRVNDLIIEDFDDPLVVLARAPECDNFFVWYPNRAYTSETRLCCVDGAHVQC